MAVLLVSYRDGQHKIKDSRQLQGHRKQTEKCTKPKNALTVISHENDVAIKSMVRKRESVGQKVKIHSVKINTPWKVR